MKERMEPSSPKPKFPRFKFKKRVLLSVCAVLACSLYFYYASYLLMYEDGKIDILRRRRDGAVFVVISSEPYYVKNQARCPSLSFHYAANTIDLDTASMTQDITQYPKYKELCFGPKIGSFSKTDGICQAVPQVTIDVLDTCKHVGLLEGIVKVPTLLKGLNNQRMRMVQDITSAVILEAAVELPETLNSRIDCANQKSCYNKFEPAMGIWDVFDKEQTLAKLASLGVCITPSQPQLEPAIFQLRSPYSYSQLLEAKAKYRLGKGAWSLGSEKDCCTKFVPDNADTILLMRQVNAAFTSSSRIVHLAQDVMSAMHSINGNSPMFPSMHWRQDDDYMKTNHALDAAKYVAAMADSLNQVAKSLLGSQQTLHVLILGDVSASRLAKIHEQLKPFVSVEFILHTKTSLLSSFDWSAAFQNADDYKSQVDFELGLRSALFIGSPFSSMSVMIASAREAASGSSTGGAAAATTIMANIDVAKGFGVIYKAQFPYGDVNTYSTDPCADILEHYPAFSNKLQLSCPLTSSPIVENPLDRYTQLTSSMFDGSVRHPKISNRYYQDRCPDLAPNFRFKIPLDDPYFHNGKQCTAVIVTSLFGTQDKLFGYHVKASTFRSLEANAGLYSCWIAFLDEEAAEQHLGTADPIVTPHSKQGEENGVGASDHVVSGGGDSCIMPNITRFGLWNIVVIPQDVFPFPVNQTAKNSRVPKMLIHRAFEHADHMIYLDSKLMWKSYHDVWPWIQQFALESSLGWVSPHHPSRHSVYEEARCVNIVGLANAEVIQQMRQYFKEGMPSGHGEVPFGLIEGEWHYRNLKSRVSSKIGCEWFREFSSWNHRRDQLSFNYILWKAWKSDWYLQESVPSPVLTNTSTDSTSSSFATSSSSSSSSSSSLLEGEEWVVDRPTRDTKFFTYADYHNAPFERVTRTSTQAAHRPVSTSCNDRHHGNRVAMELEAMMSKGRPW